MVFRYAKASNGVVWLVQRIAQRVIVTLKGHLFRIGGPQSVSCANVSARNSL